MAEVRAWPADLRWIAAPKPLQVERQIMLWERKILLEKEMQVWTSVGGGREAS